MVSHLVTQMVTLAEDVTSLPTGLVTILRVLRYLAIDPFPEKQGFLVEELKHKHILIEMYSLGCVATLTTIIQKVGDLCLRPWQQGIPQCGVQATVIMGLLKPSLELLKAIMSYLIECRGTEFKDLSILPCLFNLHTVLCSVSNTGTLSPAVQEVQNLITDILMTFTQPALEVKEFEEGLKQSLWSLMMKEVFQYSLTAPYTFLSGLVLISELLPLPLPIQTREALTNDEVESALNTRKFWGAHIFPITTDMQALIKTLSDTSCQPLQQLLRRVCWQLADLAPSTALSVTRCLLDVVTESMDASVDPHPKDETKKDRPAAEALPAAKEHVRASRQTSRILNLLAFLMNQPPIKSAFLHLTQPGVKSDDKYTDILGRFVALLNVVSDNTSHAHAQMSIVVRVHSLSIFQSLCDMMVSMVVGDSSLSFLEQLASSLPAKESLLQICIGLLNHINNREYKFCSILPSLRTLTLLMDHDYGFYYVKQALDAVPTAFFQLFTLINTTFSKDSSDCIATLSSAAECIQFLVTLPDLDPTADPDDPVRTMSISWQEVKQMLAWNSDMLNHPLDDLDKLLQDYAKEEEALKAVHESITAVCCIVKDDHPGSKSDLKEPVLSAAESLTAQFGMRAIYVLTENEDERLSSIYWLSTPMAEESDQEIEKVECDLDEMNHKYCPDYNLVAELQKGAIPSDALTTLKPRRRIRSRPTRDTINTSKMRGSNRGFIAPMRGRGFGRGMPTGRNDLFRSRPPNTSRPPSMHVDDFIKMESEGQAPSLPTGMNARRPMDKEQQQMQQQMQQQIQQQGGGAGRGGRGGFDRGGGNSRGGGFSNRGGRFLSPPNNYGRNRDTNAPGGGGSYTGASSLMGGGGAGRAFSATKGGHMLMPRMDQWSASNATDRTPQQQRNYGSRTFGSESEGRLSSTSRVDRHQMLNSGGGRFSQHSSSSNKGRGSSSSRMTDWQAQQQQQGGRKDDRFGGQQRQSFRGGGSNRGFRDNRGRHQRSFTK
ncbi:hypothetical protein CAPTEDRAFT_223433 [Capitella teleta]|uniref:Virilizer N-terminal domain-containing protein n=1 Tax=Capitella teleta TaxID=283909 RepID=R7UHF1_CAPTE|nr:hypothetical protein CAPTEDRAFT_223433 [Capitella teleta]|eukprot:ELU02702.1 hypothetical protein CAPTEDRAFT_223433 [Capitella teleta]